MVTKLKQLWTSSDSPRQAQTRVILRGAADDRGVMNVGGRIGAAHGPDILRKNLSNYMLGLNGELNRVSLLPGSNVPLKPTIAQTHEAFAELLATDLKAGAIPVAIGGGHDYGYPHVLAASRTYGPKKVALINIDAHLDVREVTDNVISSGSPFFLALEKGAILPQNFVEFGIQEHCNDQKYGAYVKKKKVKVIMLNDARKKQCIAAFRSLLKTLSAGGKKVVVSFDVDAVQMCSAPGVSAPQADGFTAGEFLEFAKLCGESKAVVSIGFFELSPPLDLNDMTTKLVATAVHRFACGVARR